MLRTYVVVATAEGWCTAVDPFLLKSPQLTLNDRGQVEEEEILILKTNWNWIFIVRIELCCYPLNHVLLILRQRRKVP